MNEYELIVILENLKKQQIDFNIEIYNMDDLECKNLHVLLSSFSNAKGGSIIFGIDHKTNDVIGISDYENLKKNILEISMQMVPIITPSFELFNIYNKKILVLNISQLDDKQKPCYHTKSSIFDGAYIRKGHNNIELNQIDIQLMKRSFGAPNDEIRTYPNVDYHELDVNLLNSYISKIKKIEPDATNLEYEDILNFCKITQEYAPTLIGILAFAKDPTKYFPKLYVEVYHIDEYGKKGISKEFKGKLTEIIDNSTYFISKATASTAVPEDVIKRCILASLINRDYSKYSENTPIYVEIYNDRIMFKVPGGLFNNVKPSELGKKSYTLPNPALKFLLSTMLEEDAGSDSKIAQDIFDNFYSLGFRTVEFTTKNAEVTTILYFSREDMTEKILEFCKTSKDIGEIRKFLKVESKHYTMIEFIMPLLQSGKIAYTIPEFPESKFQKYITVTK